GYGRALPRPGPGCRARGACEAEGARNRIVCKQMEGVPLPSAATHIVPAIRNSARHARKCKAPLAVGNGFIFAVDFPRLSARKVGNSARPAQIHARKSKKQGSCAEV